MMRPFPLNSGVAFVAVLVTASFAAADPITLDGGGSSSETFHFRTFQGPNNVGLFSVPGMEGQLTFGLANVSPGVGTTVTASQGGVAIPLTFLPQTVTPGLFANFAPYSPTLTGSWTFTIVNGADTLIVSSPAVGDVGLPPPVSDLSLLAGEPRFMWTSPAGIDAITIQLYDRDNRIGGTGVADRIASAELPANTTSYDVPVGLLQPGGNYTLAVDSTLTNGPEAGTNPSGSSREGSTRSRTRTFYDFAFDVFPDGFLPDGTPVFLPQVISDAAGITFLFDNAVSAGQTAYYDPVVAIGYDFLIGEGDPNFASLILPLIGDGSFDLFLHDDEGWTFDRELTAGVEHMFDLGGVDRFRILGISPDLGLDPENPTAFVTGLSFVADGRFTGTMTPILADRSSVPAISAPPAFAALGLALVALGALRRRRGLSSRRRSPGGTEDAFDHLIASRSRPHHESTVARG